MSPVTIPPPPHPLHLHNLGKIYHPHTMEASSQYQHGCSADSCPATSTHSQWRAKHHIIIHHFCCSTILFKAWSSAAWKHNDSKLFEQNGSRRIANNISQTGDMKHFYINTDIVVMIPGSARLCPAVCVSNNVTWSGDYRGDMTIWLQHQYSLQPPDPVTVSPGWKVEISRRGDSAVTVYNVVCCHLVDIMLYVVTFYKNKT